jgi:hypothetical protein
MGKLGKVLALPFSAGEYGNMENFSFLYLRHYHATFKIHKNTRARASSWLKFASNNFVVELGGGL